MTRRQLLALTLPASVILLCIGEAFTPRGLDRPITDTAIAHRALIIAREHTTQLYVSNLLVIVGLGLLGVAFTAIAGSVQGRGRALATIAGAAGAFGGFFGGLANMIVGYDLASAARADAP